MRRGRLPKWGGRRAQAWTRAVLSRYGTRCALRYPNVCTDLATTGDHVIPRSVRPDLQYDVTNGQPACLPCNRKRGATAIVDALIVDARSFFESAALPGRTSAQSPPRDPRKFPRPTDGERP